jgi:hypothetical protein
MFKTVRMGYEFIRFPYMGSYVWCQKIQYDLVTMKGMGLFFQNRLGQSAGLGNPANQGGRRAAQVYALSCVLGVKHSKLPARLR